MNRFFYIPSSQHKIQQVVFYAIKKACKSKQKQAKNHTKAYKSTQIHTNGRAKGEKAHYTTCCVVCEGGIHQATQPKQAATPHPPNGAEWDRRAFHSP
jgi:hypothetical protein